MEDLKSKIELTNLKSSIVDQDVEFLIQAGYEKNFLGICIPPFWVKKAARDIGSRELRLITVVGFPFGFQRTESKIKEVELAVEDGVDEVDLVWSITAFKAGMNWPKIELAKAAQTCHKNGIPLKVIIETALLEDEEIKEASKICSDSGADFVKTSTGFSTRGASVRDIEIIKESIPSTVGIKASGGINNRDFAEELVKAGASRIGSSSAHKWL